MERATGIDKNSFNIGSIKNIGENERKSGGGGWSFVRGTGWTQEGYRNKEELSRMDSLNHL